jgi:sigma-B regulation protein RsbU (phosphoserine phosphatase)
MAVMPDLREGGLGPPRLTAETKYRLLLQIAQSLSGTLDLDEILNHLLDLVREAIPYDAAGVFVLTGEDPALKRGHPRQLIAGMAARGFPPRPSEDDRMLRLGQGIIGHVIRTGEFVVAPDVALEPKYVVGRTSTRSEIAIPIVMHRRTIGALNLESDALHAYSDADVEVLRFFSNAAAISIEKAMLHRQVLERRYIQGQLQIAQEVQRRLLPRENPGLPGYDIAGISLPTFDIGGDYYDYIPLPDGRLGLVVADVAGKGIPAALIMSTFRALLRTCARRGQSVSEAVGEVNGMLVESIGLPAFVTSVYGVLEPGSGRFTYANCGHNAPLIVRAGGAVDRLDSSGPFLGVFDGTTYVEQQTRLEPGDVLLLYTDGAVELERDTGEEFGTDRLVSLASATRERDAAETIHAVVEATREFTGAPVYEDDFTLVIVKRRD